MGWLIIRVFNDRIGKNVIDVLKKRSALGTPDAQEVARLTERFGVEANLSASRPLPHKEWPWSIAAYTSRSRDGIGRAVGQFIFLPARPKKKEQET